MAQRKRSISRSFGMSESTDSDDEAVVTRVIALASGKEVSQPEIAERARQATEKAKRNATHPQQSSLPENVIGLMAFKSRKSLRSDKRIPR